MFRATVQFQENQPPRWAPALQQAFADNGIPWGTLKSPGGRELSVTVNCDSIEQVAQVIVTAFNAIPVSTGRQVLVNGR